MKKTKKREKKKFKRQNIKLQNIDIESVDDFESSEVVSEKRAEKKTKDKCKATLKSDIFLKKGRVIQIMSNYRTNVKINDKVEECNIGGRLKQINFETRNVLAIGDEVQVDVKNQNRIETILPRKNSLSRYLEYLEDEFQKEIVVASNIDQVIVTTSIKEPEISFGLIDRYITSAKIAKINPIICINKVDLVDSFHSIAKMISFYEECGIKVIKTSVKNKSGLNELKEVLKDKDSVFSGHSGAGKSSIINALQPNLKRSVASISNSTQKGAHTTTNSILFTWDFGGNLIDTPGIKTFGLKLEDKKVLPRIFPGFDILWSQCKFPDCSHTHEEECEIKKRVEQKIYPKERYLSYLRILDSLETN